MWGRLLALGVALAVGATGCTGELSFGQVDSPFPVRDSGPPVDRGPVPDFGPRDDPNAAPEDRTAGVVCTEWNRRSMETTDTQTTGADPASCTPGAATAAALADATARLNLFRWLNGLNEVPHSTDPARLASQQECALMMAVNGSLSHGPPMSWNCWTTGGNEAAGSSNLHLGFRSAANSVNSFMIDNGANNARVGHRRWFLHDRLGSIAFGTAVDPRGATCAHVFDGSGIPSGRPYTTFPNPGYAPIQQIGGNGNTTTRWSFSGDVAPDDQVRVSRNGERVLVAPDPGNLVDGEPAFFAGGGFGTGGALVWLPSGWVPTTGDVLTIEIGDVGGLVGGARITYEVRLIDCTSE